MKEKTKTVTMYVSRLQCGMTCGKYGLLFFKKSQDATCGHDAGVLSDLLQDWEPLGDDSEVEVTVTVKKKTKAKVNPWHTKMLKEQRQCAAERKRRTAYEKRLKDSWGGKGEKE